MIKKTAIFDIERAIVPFVRLGVILLFTLTLIGCSKPKYDIGDRKENNILLIQSQLVRIPQKEIILIDEYVGNQNGATYYFMFYRVTYLVDNEEQCIFFTILHRIKSDLSIEYASFTITQGSD